MAHQKTTERTSVKDRYISGAHALVSGDFHVDFTDLPPIAYDYWQDDTPGNTPIENHELAENIYHTPEAYRHLAWWAYNTFRSFGDDKPDRYYSPNGAGLIGIIQMTKHLSDIVSVYAAESDKPPTYDEQVQEIATLAITSPDTLEFIAQQNVAVAGVLERNALLRGTKDRTVSSRQEAAKWIFDIREVDGAKKVVYNQDLEGQATAVQRNYEKSKARVGESTLPTIGCFALKALDADQQSVFFSIWHGLVLAAAKHPELIQAQLEAHDKAAHWDD